jgi:hypothetical protein
MAIAESAEHEDFVPVDNHAEFITVGYRPVDGLYLCPYPFTHIEYPNISQRGVASFPIRALPSIDQEELM